MSNETGSKRKAQRTRGPKRARNPLGCEHPFSQFTLAQSFASRSLAIEGLPGGDASPAIARHCVDCGARLSLGPSNDDPAGVQIEIDAAEIAQDVIGGIDPSLAMPSRDDELIGWHGVMPPWVTNDWKAGALARDIVDHGIDQDAAAEQVPVLAGSVLAAPPVDAISAIEEHIAETASVARHAEIGPATRGEADEFDLQASSAVPPLIPLPNEAAQDLADAAFARSMRAMENRQSERGVEVEIEPEAKS